MRTIVSIFICLFIFAGLNAQDQAEITSKIRKVTLFPNRAQIYHDGMVDIPAGKTVLKVKGLSPKLLAGSLQVSGEGDFMIMAVNHKMNYLEKPEESKDVKELRSRITELQLKIENENTYIGVLSEKEAFLVANRLIAARNSSISSSEFKILTEQYVSGIESVRLGIQNRSRVVKTLMAEKQNLENQVANVINRNSMPSAEVLITVLSNKNLKAKISLNYLVANAGWYPSYDIRVGSTDSPVEIFYKANAFQNTGVDWDNVLLSFSSASPSASGIMPTLNPWFINFQQSIAIRGMSSRAAPQASRMKSLDEVYEFDDSEMIAEAPPVVISTSGTNFSFDLDIPQNIPSTGEETLIEIQRVSANSSYKYISIPKLRKEVFLTAGISEWESLNLLDGKANIYFGNVFTGETYISRSQTDDTLKISLGKDEGITVKREKRTDFTSKRTLGSNRHDTRSFLLTIRNNRSNSISVDLMDQIPISRNNQISVDAEELSGGTLNPISGEVKWNLNLKPNESREFVITYTVKFPKNQKVILE